MIKPVKRNKRLKWIDSRYAYKYRVDKLVDLSINGVAIDWGVPTDMLVGKNTSQLPKEFTGTINFGRSILYEVYKALKEIEKGK
jgi:hypothetical protein